VSGSGKLALRIAERIENEILDRALRPGHRLGTEAELTERYRVSRAVLYEAIRLVERHQLATTRRGAGGGLFVAEPAEEAVAQLMCAYLDSIRVGIPELFEALRLVQGESVRLAAERGGADDVAELRAMLEGQREPAPAVEEARRFNAFYGRVAALADSPALALFVRALDQAAEHIGLSLRFPRAVAARDWKVMRRCMIRVADAISSGRRDAASEEMVQYLAKLERSFLAREPRSKLRAAGDRKRSDALAREILDEIRRLRARADRALRREPRGVARGRAPARAARRGRDAARARRWARRRRARSGLGDPLRLRLPEPATPAREAL
jgi:DNA-binding FadR family transcriptional regulator